jgi:hypothetical protein
MSTNHCNRQESIAEGFLNDLTLYRHVGLDEEGRAHFYAPDANEIVVTDTDRRHQGVRDDDIEERIPVGEKTVAQYCRYVRFETDTAWQECDWMAGWE